MGSSGDGTAVGRPRPDALRLARRAVATVRNAAEFVRYGGLETGDRPAPFAVAAEQPSYRLRHYFADAVPEAATPILLVPPLMMATEVWDVSPQTSAVRALHAAGADPWVVDFGDPGHEPHGLERNLTDHVLAVGDAVDRVVAATGHDVVLGGYSQGGMFAYQAAALRRAGSAGSGIDSLVTFGSPVDTTAPLPIPLAPEVVARLVSGLLESGLLRHLALPRWATRTGFQLLSPAKTVRSRIEFLRALHDRDSLLPREAQRRFLEREGFTAYSGPAIAELLEQFVAHNRMLEGGFVIDDRLVTLADLAVPILTVVGASDTIGHPDAVRAIRRAAPRSDVYELTEPSGHFGLVVGSNASAVTWPAVAAWIAWRRGDTTDLPDGVVPAELVVPRPLRPAPTAAVLAQATELGVGATRLLIGTARATVRAAQAARGVAAQAPAQLPRLARIERLDPGTRISLGLILDEQARRDAEGICFLFGDRAYRQRDVKRRVEAVVKGLIGAGVRPGARVGVLMHTRPSAFTVVAALSRLGATAVLLRPDGDVAREAGLGEIDRVICDPEHATGRDAIPGVEWCVLGGGGEWRELHPDVVDLERVDPDEVAPPGWYRANPHRAADIAFVLFSGEGEHTRAVPISNRRWALSALGTASAAALRPGDTVYSVTPIHHSSALLMSVGGAVAGGARFAMATATDPETFWAEVRRYGATHVSYTWTSLHDVTLGPPNPNERHHPIRIFMGSGLPRNLWRRVSERFPTARVLEFYASAEGEVILANLTGHRPGSMGRPLPGAAEVRVAAFDLATRELVLDEAGMGRESDVDEVGLLLARLGPAEAASAAPSAAVLHGVFEPDDAWRSTGDLFLRDAQGELWLAGAVADIVDTAARPVLAAGARFCLGTVPAVDLIVAYGVADPDVAGAQCLVAAVTLRAGAELSAADLDLAFDRLPRSYRPSHVQVVPEIPVTTWCRPLWRPLQAEGVPRPAAGRVVFALGPDRAHYRRL